MPRDARVVAPVCAALLVACAASETSGISGALVFGAAPVTPSATVAVYDLEEHSLCSGLLLGPQQVLTARHCVQPPGEAAMDPRRFVVWVGPSDREIVAHAAVIVITTPSPPYAGLGELAGEDVAVLLLEEPLSGSFAAFYEGPLVAGATVESEAYGAPAGGTAGTLRRTAATVLRVHSQQIFTSPITCDGDSGGPLFIDDSLLGLASFRAPGPCGRGSSAFTRLEAHRRWIERVAALGVGACETSPECLARVRCDLEGACAPLGSVCATADECGSGACSAPEGDTQECVRGCDPRLGASLCRPGEVCVRQPALAVDGACVTAIGSFGRGASCVSDRQCASGLCLERVCADVCAVGRAECADGERCAGSESELGGCVSLEETADAEQRGLGEPCVADAQCSTELCHLDGSSAYCTQACARESECPLAFRCIGGACLRGVQQVGDRCDAAATPCPTALDCMEGTCSRACDDSRPCPDGARCEAIAGGNFCRFTGEPLDAPCSDDAQCRSRMCSCSVCTQVCGVRQPCPVGYRCVRDNEYEDGRCVSRGGWQTPSGCGVVRAAPLPLARVAAMFSSVLLLFTIRTARRRRLYWRVRG